MTDLLPGFKDQLQATAQRLEDADGLVSAGRTAASSRRRVRRLHGRGLAVAVLIGAAGASGVAYAAKGLWNPALGNGRGGGVATASPLPTDQTRALGVLRREQTDSDRGPASRMALAVAGDRTLVRTNAVRRLATGLNGGAVVLVPYKTNKTVSRESLRHWEKGQELETVSRDDQLCLVRVQTGMAGVNCGDTNDLLAGRLTGGMGLGSCIDAQSRQAFEASQAGERKLAASEGRAAVRLDCLTRRPGTERNFLAGVVPDGVAAVRLGRRPGARVVPVRDNLWQSEGGTLSSQVWLDAEGRELSRKLADTKRRLGIDRP